MATIIKRGEQLPSPAGESVQGVAFDLEEMSAHGDRYLDQVRAEATKIVQQANAEAQQIRQQAEQAGQQAAEQAMEKLLAKKIGHQMQTLQPAIEGIATGIESERAGWLAHWESSVLQLATQVAEKIIRREIASTPEITTEWAREALELVSGASELTVRLHPSDHAHLGAHVEQLVKSIAKAAQAEVVADEAISPGGCVVETHHGVVDAQVETQIARMIEELV